MRCAYADGDDARVTIIIRHVISSPAIIVIIITIL